MHKIRPIDASVFAEARSRGFDPVLSRILAGRVSGDVKLDSILDPQLQNIAPPSELVDIDAAAMRLAEAIKKQQLVGVLTDYDADGLTSHAVIYDALVRFGLPKDCLSHWIGHRLEDGYGISKPLVDRLLQNPLQLDVVISADCGSSDEMQIARLAQAGIDVIITDHHQVSESGPPASAHAVVNPNRIDCPYPDKAIAGCMVSWLVMSHLRQVLVDQNVLHATTAKLGDLLDYVALGTVADCVSMGSSETNRAIVMTGLSLITRQKRPCWQVAISQLTKSPSDITAELLAFQLAPRLNARGRIGHSLRGFEFLVASSVSEASDAFMDLDQDNKTRRIIERDMVMQAIPIAQRQHLQGSLVICVVLEEGHPGVQGIVASRLVEAEGRASIVLTRGNDPEILTGSMRSIPGVDAKAILDQVKAQTDDLLIRFGGHVGACGMTLKRARLPEFVRTLQSIYRDKYADIGPRPRFVTDGELLTEQLSVEWIQQMDALGPFGRGFEQPLFTGLFQVRSARPVGQNRTHLSLLLTMDSLDINAVWFSAIEPGQPSPMRPGDLVECVYSLSVNSFNGLELSMIIRDCALKLKGKIHV